MVHYNTFVLDSLMRRSHLSRFAHDWNRGLYRERVGMILPGPIRSYYVLMSVVEIGLIVEKNLAVKQFSTINTIARDYRDHRIRSYGIITMRNNTYLIVFPNLCDQDQCWRRQTSRSVEMCCDLQLSETICHDFSGPIAHNVTRMAHELIRADASKCD